MFKFKPFQVEDLARAALHDGLILGQDTGLGKTIALYVWPALKLGLDSSKPCLRPKGAVLLVVPGDGHDQTSEEGQLHFQTRPIRIDSQAAFLRLSTLGPKGRRVLPNGYYLISYTQLADNGVQPFPPYTVTNTAALMRDLHLTDAGVEKFWNDRGNHFREQYSTLHSTPKDPLSTIRSRYFKLRKEYLGNDAVTNSLDNAFETIELITAKSFSQLTDAQLKFLRGRFVALKHNEYSVGIGETKNYTVPGVPDSSFQVKCVYSPSVADLSHNTFDCVCIDEGTKIKGEHTIIGRGVRLMNPRYRLITTATPIKNRLPDIFRLAWWVAGAHQDPTPRFPYGNDSEHRDDFAQEFLVSERNLSAEARAELSGGGSRPRIKLTPQVCNIHRLWKLFAPIVLRRRKHDCGEQLVAKLRHVVRVPMGTRQSLVYRYHLEAKYVDKNGMPAIGAKLQALRVAAANPASELLEPVEGDHAAGLISRAGSPYTPKLAGALNLILQCLKAREQVIIFGAFYDSLDPIADRLRQAGVPSLTLDGRLTQIKRGKLAAEFKKGPARSRHPVCLAGAECMAEMHSFHLCRNVILLAYSWAWDKFEQGINRIHRLNSPNDVHVWSILCDGTIDRKLEGLIQEKGDASELVLDGKLLGESSAEVNLADILHTAYDEFNPPNRLQTIGESDLEKQWPQLRSSLADAWRVWNSSESPRLALPNSAVLLPLSEPAALLEPNPHPAPPTRQGKAPDSGRTSYDDLPLWQQSLPWQNAA